MTEVVEEDFKGEVMFARALKDEEAFTGECGKAEEETFQARAPD